MADLLSPFRFVWLRQFSNSFFGFGATSGTSYIGSVSDLFTVFGAISGNYVLFDSLKPELGLLARREQDYIDD